MRRGIGAALLVLVGLMPPAAGAQDAPSSDEPGTPFFRKRDAYVVGGFVLGAIGFAQLDRRLAHTLQDPALQESAFVEHGAEFFRFLGDPGPQLIGGTLYAVGRVAEIRPLAALGLHGLEGVLLGDAITGVIKGVAGRARPYVHVDTVPHDFHLFRGFRGSTDYRSFPSGHTTSAFAVAAATTGEIYYWTSAKGWWPGWPWVAGSTLFTAATLVGVSRMYHDAHWASDVVTGAAIGTFSGFKVVRYAYRHPENRLDRWLLPEVAPDPDGRGAMLVWSVPVGGAAAR